MSGGWVIDPIGSHYISMSTYIVLCPTILNGLLWASNDVRTSCPPSLQLLMQQQLMLQQIMKAQQQQITPTQPEPKLPTQQPVTQTSTTSSEPASIWGDTTGKGLPSNIVNLRSFRVCRHLYICIYMYITW